MNVIRHLMFYASGKIELYYILCYHSSHYLTRQTKCSYTHYPPYPNIKRKTVQEKYLTNLVYRKSEELYLHLAAAW